jgi:hypothetical protein
MTARTTTWAIASVDKGPRTTPTSTTATDTTLRDFYWSGAEAFHSPRSRAAEVVR